MSEVRFTPAQLAALDIARSRQDTCIVAGPGSGKTTVLVEYFRRLVEAGADPLRILSITFTEKAAGNMRDKLARAFADNPERRARLERAWVSTIHGFCARLLREHAVFAGIDPEFGVADELEAWRMRQESIAAALEELFGERPAAVRALIRGLSSPEFEPAVLSAYDAMRGAGKRVEDLAAFATPADEADIATPLDALRRDSLAGWTATQKQYLAGVLEAAGRVRSAPGPLAGLEAIGKFLCNLNKCKRGTAAYELVRQLREAIGQSTYRFITELYAPERKTLIDLLARFDRLYRARKRSAGLLDFADLEEFAVRLLEERPDVRTRVVEQFDYVLMDELQDTNGQQAHLLKLVCPPDRLYAVGDINQSIFGFRHAEPREFAEFRDAVARRGRRLVELTENFRSRPEILSAVETIAAGAEGLEPRPLQAARVFETERPVCVEVIGVSAADIDDALRLEARWVARRIEELTGGEGFAFQDCAVLVRNTEVIGEFSAAFDEAGIPYLVNRGRGFYEAREVNDAVHLLRVIANPRDEIALVTVLLSPLVAVSDEALLRLKSASGDMADALARLRPADAAGFDREDHARLCRFRDRLHEWRLRREYVTFDRLLMAALDESGYCPEAGARGAANLDKFLAQARVAAGRMSLDEFVEELAWVRASNPREPDAPPEDSADAVRVMTVHSAKGLEFPVVFVAALHKGTDTDPPVVAFSPRVGLGARWRNPAKSGGREEKGDLFQHALRQERHEREAEEGNRLLYVAMTRAEQHLVLSFSGNGRKPANWAELVVRNLEVGHALACPVVTLTAPDGKPWNLRLLLTDRAPEPLVRITAAPPLAAPAPREAAALPPPLPLAGQPDANATVTALAKFANCPRAYYLGEYLGFEGRPRGTAETAEAGALTAAEFGSQVHALLAGTKLADADPEAVRLAETFRRSPLGKRVARAGRIEREFDFLMAVEGLVTRGQVDLWFEEGGELVLVDYKTDAVSAAEAHRRAGDYALQLRLYAMAVERIAGRPPDRAWLHFLRPNALVEVDLAPSLLEPPEAVVRDFEQAQARLEFPLREGDHCHRCPFFRDLCPAGTTSA
jgi:ATP-dependent exoDNAse (exonuclease V) beta subunit